VLVLAVAAAVVAVVMSRGTYETSSRSALQTSAQQARAPAWTRPCWASVRGLGAGKPACAHVRGRVVWIQKHDPDGDGDRHVILMARLHPRIVKLGLRLGPVPLPRIGAQVDATGWLSLGASGHYEIDTEHYVSGDVVADRR
jgi:hypothetical protein